MNNIFWVIKLVGLIGIVIYALIAMHRSQKRMARMQEATLRELQAQVRGLEPIVSGEFMSSAFVMYPTGSSYEELGVSVIDDESDPEEIIEEEKATELEVTQDRFEVIDLGE